jgi:hypothetical protein
MGSIPGPGINIHTKTTANHMIAYFTTCCGKLECFSDSGKFLTWARVHEVEPPDIGRNAGFLESIL